MSNKIHYEIVGEGVPIIILNGYFNDMRAWKGALEPLFAKQTGYQRIYLDYPGTGLSTYKDHVHNWNDLFREVLQLIDDCIPNQDFIVVGHSFGGFLARGIVKHKFDSIMGVLLTCPVIHPRLEERMIDKQANSKLHHTKEQALQVKRRLNREVVKSRNNTDKDYMKQLRKDSLDARYDFDDLLEPFNKPTLIISGKQDKVVGYKDSFTLLDNFKHATYVVLDNAKHDIQIEQSDLFTVLVSEWLTRINDFKYIENE